MAVCKRLAFISRSDDTGCTTEHTAEELRSIAVLGNVVSHCWTAWLQGRFRSPC